MEKSTLSKTEKGENVKIKGRKHNQEGDEEGSYLIMVINGVRHEFLVNEPFGGPVIPTHDGDDYT